jgi:hypothetical protein
MSLNLLQIRAFKFNSVTGGYNFDYYVVGFDYQGGISGIWTHSVET